VGPLLTYNTRDVNKLQARLAGERCERLRDRLCGNVGGEHPGFKGLGQRCRSIDERNGRANSERAKHPGHHCSDVC
jgi:hypothetical protein